MELKNWESKSISEICNVEYGTRVVRKRDGGSKYSVYGGGGATFFMDEFNREDCLVIARFAMSEKCTRFVFGKFFLNDSGLSITPKNNFIIFQEFLNYQILFLNDYIYSLGRGTAQRNLDMPKFRKLKISYSNSIEEQKRIVKILDETFEKLEKVKEKTEKNLNNSKEIFESELNNIFENPKENWKEKELNDISKIISGYSFDSKYFSQNNEIKVIKITNVGINEFIEDNIFLPKKFELEYKKFQVNENEIVIALTRTIISGGLKVAIIPKSYNGALVNQRVAALKPITNKSNKNYLYYFFKTNIMINYVLSNVNTLMQPNLSINDLKKLKIPLPSLQEQKRIVNKIDKLQEKTKQLEIIYQNKLNNIEELKKSILNKAFKGKL